MNEAANVMQTPELHTNLGADLDQICVNYGGATTLDIALASQIVSLDSGLAPAPGTLGLGKKGEVACP